MGGFNIEEGFKVGQAIAGEDSAMSSFVKQMAARLQQKRELEQKFQLGVAQEQALGPIRTQQAIAQEQALAPVRLDNDITKSIYQGQIDQRNALNLQAAKGAQDLELEQEKSKLESQAAIDFFRTMRGGGGGMSGGTVTQLGTAPATSDPTMTGFSLKGPGGSSFSFETPEKGQLEAQTAFQKQVAEMAPTRQALRGRLKSMKQLIDQVPAQKPGIGRIFGGMNTAWKGMTQEIPQIAQYDREKKLSAGLIIQILGGETSARLSDFDVKRGLNAFANASYDTENNRILSFLEIQDSLNAIPEIGEADPLKVGDLLTPKEYAKGRAIQGRLPAHFSHVRFDPDTGTVQVGYPDGSTLTVD